MVTPAIGVPVAVATLPEIEYVAAMTVPVKFWPVIFAPLSVTALFVGENV
jgi:hypothetical protein